MDAESPNDFDAKLLSLRPTWNEREKNVRGLSDDNDAEFHKYFVANVAQDMKKKMILPVRQRAGLGDSMFYNNAAESRHKQLKDRKKQLYGDRKLDWVQTVELVEAISEEEERNAERAIVDEGPYEIRPEFSSKLGVSFDAYIAKSHRGGSARRCIRFSWRMPQLHLSM